jgi:hypothetical protein
MGDSPQTDKLPWQQEALNLIWKQKAPRSWQVFSGKKALLPYNYYGYAAFGLILLLCPLAAFLALNLFTEKCSSGKGRVRTCHPPFWPNLNVSLYWLVVGGIIVALLVATVIISRLIVARKKREDPQPLVIVLPEGWVHYLSPSDPVDAIAFAELADLRGKTEPDPKRSRHWPIFRAEQPLPKGAPGSPATRNAPPHRYIFSGARTKTRRKPGRHTSALVPRNRFVRPFSARMQIMVAGKMSQPGAGPSAPGWLASQ